ncbi:MAG: HIT domain-containing protein [Pseudomonadales bacterium]|nr:HIT domain-containing protein [Pseudomonadales bacterium]
MFELDERLANDTIKLASWPLCEVLLMNDRHYPWFILVPRVPQISELYHLDAEQQKQFQEESNRLSMHIMKQFAGYKLNVAALGNVVRQLHIHHIVRFESDVAWPGPVWGKVPSEPYTEEELASIQSGATAWLSLPLFSAR